MKLLLTSAGLSNKTIRDKLLELIGKGVKQSSIVYIPTASNVEPGHKDWLMDDLNNIYNMGFKSFDILDISGLSKKHWLPRIEEADTFILGGGNTYHLMHWVKESGLQEELPRLLESKLYVGISAGSQITNPLVDVSIQNELFDREGNEYDVKKGLEYVNFYTIPHYQSEYFPNLTEENVRNSAKNISCPVYALDDDSAIVVKDGEIEVISEGTWDIFNA